MLVSLNVLGLNQPCDLTPSKLGTTSRATGTVHYLDGASTTGVSKRLLAIRMAPLKLLSPSCPGNGEEGEIELSHDKQKNHLLSQVDS